MNENILHARIENDFKHHPPRAQERVEAHEKVRAVLRGAALHIVDLVPEGREMSLALTKLEEAMMWANAGIARHS